MRTRVVAMLFAGVLGISGLTACEPADEPAEPGRDKSMLQPEPQMSGAAESLNPYPSGDQGEPGAPGTAP